MRELRLRKLCLEEEDEVISHVYLQDINIYNEEKRRKEVQAQDDPS
jgi:hypothetical protein